MKNKYDVQIKNTLGTVIEHISIAANYAKEAEAHASSYFASKNPTIKYFTARAYYIEKQGEI